MYVEETQRFISSTRYTVRGDLDGVLGRIKELFADYHPLGYGTNVKGIFYSYHKDGPYEAVVERANSCD